MYDCGPVEIEDADTATICRVAVLVYVHVGIHVLCVGLLCGSATRSQPGPNRRHW